MAPSTNPLAPDPTTDIDGPEVFPPLDPEQQEDLTQAVPLDEDDEFDPDDEEEEEEATDEEDPL